MLQNGKEINAQLDVLNSRYEEFEKNVGTMLAWYDLDVWIR
jgi:hypothetical protein